MKVSNVPSKPSTIKGEATTFVSGFVVAMIVIAPFYALGKLIVHLFRDSESKARSIIAKFEEKIEARKYIRAEYKADPENALVKAKRGENKEWYDSWLKGEVLDPLLQWAPEVYLESDGERFFNEGFIRYLELQLTMHEKINGESVLMRTIKEFYPEFSSVGFAEVRKDIESIKERITARKLKQELSKTLGDLGLDSDQASLVIGLGGKNIKEQAEKFLKFYYNGFYNECAIDFIKKGYTISPEVEEIIKVVTEEGIYLEDATWEYLIKGDITPDEFGLILKHCLANKDEDDTREEFATAMDIAVASCSEATPVWERN